MLVRGARWELGEWGEVIPGTDVFSNVAQYDPATNTWSPTGSAVYARAFHTATLLQSGKVLAAGGFNFSSNLASTEIYDPTTNTWGNVGNLLIGRTSHTATLLLSGKVLVTGGSSNHPTTNFTIKLGSAELYDPGTNTWSRTSTLGTARAAHSATLLPDGRVLVVGGYGNTYYDLASAELYDPATNALPITGPFAYITHFQSNYVSVIDIPTNTVVTTITVGQSPQALAIAPSGTDVYVSNYSSNSVSLIYPESMAEIAYFPVGTGPRALFVAPNGRRLYVANNGSNSVSVIDTTNLQVLVAIPVGSNPWGLIVTPDSSKIYVANHDSNSVSVISASSNTVVKTITVGSQPLGLNISPDGSKVFVTEFGSNAVSVINTATDTVLAQIAVDAGPFGVALALNGSKLYVTSNLDTVSVIDTASNLKTASIAVGLNPQGISVTPDGSKVLVDNYGGNSLSVINAATNMMMATILLANGPVSFGGFIGSQKGKVIEFYNTNLDNYFITIDANEAAAIDAGSAGPGWVRTGNTFNSGGSTPVCRFYGSQSPGPNSHFYTSQGAECAGLKNLQVTTPVTDKRWNFESLDFLTTVPINGNCPTGTMLVYRAYNNGFARGVDSNHRITSSQSAIQQVVARGWSNEGVVMCTPL